ncbi:permease [Anoxybacillus flavithermus]|nr:permease [Anoxybacillus flavithermus]
MFNVPNSRSKQWYRVSTFLFFLFLCLLLASRILLSIKINFEQFISFSIISFILSCIIGVSGFFGKTTFAMIFSSFSIVGVLYTLFISFTRMHDGWSDITSVISFLTISMFGVVVGVIAEVIHTLFKKKLK